MPNDKGLYILGGYQTDFANNVMREGGDIESLFVTTLTNGLAQAKLEAADIDVGHVGNFASFLFTGQAHLGGFFGHADPALTYLPASSHEAACASGSMALLAASADLESGRYGLACVMGIEIMRNTEVNQAVDNLRPAAWAGKEWTHTPYIWPAAFDQLLEVYDERYGIDYRYLTQIAEKNFANAKANENAQTRGWQIDSNCFEADDEINPTVYGRLRRYDCGQITDGAAVVFLANHERASEYAQQRGLNLADIPRIKGWGHRTAPMSFDKKIALSRSSDYLFPHIHKVFQEALTRSELNNVEAVDGLEVHDCFSITEYMILDHTGLYAPGEAWKALDNEDTSKTGRLPVNASGGLMGCGHPVGASGIRMTLDCYKQVTEQAGEYQIPGARNMMTLNIGGSATTCASLVVGY